MGLIFDPVTARKRVVHALILAAVWSRHMFGWLFTQTTADVIEVSSTRWELLVVVPPFGPRAARR